MRLNTLRRMLTGRRARAARGPRPRRSAFRAFSLPLATMETRVLPAVTIQIDYTDDTDHFFNTQAKRDLLQFAANTIAASLNDSLSPLVAGGSNTWSATFPDPATGTLRTIPNLAVPANTLIIYVGGGRLSGASEAGLGSTGGYNASGDAAWLNTVAARGQAGALAATPNDFGPWGGSIAFDDSGATNWYFGLSYAGLTAAQTDFLSVAEHEIGHVLGLGTAPSWDDQVSGGAFHGPTAMQYYGNQPVPVAPTGDHWAEGVQSDGGPAVMNPVLINGTRALFTELDYAALRDVGWQVLSPAPAAQFALSSFVGTAGTAATVTVLRTGGSMPILVPYATADGTARAGVDYQATAGYLSFGYGELIKTFTVPVLSDPAANGPLTAGLSLGTPSNGGVLGALGAAVLTINNGRPHEAPVDFNADGRTDPGVFRPSTAQWIVAQTAAGLLSPIPAFGATGLFDIPVPGDYDGVGHAELAVFRPSTGQWIVRGPTGDHIVGTFGATNLFDIPVPGDYDGTGHTELAVFRPSTAQWIVRGPSGDHVIGTFGARNLFDIPVPGDYDGVGHTEMAVFRPSTGQWIVRGPGGDHVIGTFGWANLFDIPVPGDYDGVGHTEMAVYRPSTGQWIVNGPNGGYVFGPFGVPNYVDIPIQTSVGSLIKLGLAGQPPFRIAARSVRTGPLETAPASTPPASQSASAPVSAPLTVVIDPAALPVPRRRGQTVSRPGMWRTALG